MHSSFLSVWDVVNHEGIRKKPAEKAVLENMEHDPMFHIEIRNEYGDNSLVGLNLMEEYKLLLHDNMSKGIRGVTQPTEENSLRGQINGAAQYSIGVPGCSNGVRLH